MITELKQPKSKSPKYLKNVLLNALEEFNKNKVLSVAVVLVMKDDIHTDFAVSPKGSYAELIGALESMKTSAKEEWDID